MNNGEIVYNGVTPGSTAHLVCDKGYVASQETRDRVCLCNGVWSGSETQVCEAAGDLYKYVGDLNRYGKLYSGYRLYILEHTPYRM